MSGVDTTKSVSYILVGEFGGIFDKKNVGYVLTGKQGAVHSSKNVAYILIGPPPEIDMTIIRAWGCTLDGHDFYLIRLGDDYTLVYDDATGQWAHWHSPSLDYFRPRVGMNWPGFGTSSIARGFNWNIVAGDDSTNNLWMLDPLAGDDENTLAGSTAFEREVTAAVSQRGRATQRVNQAYLTMSLGSPQLTGANIQLQTSDDGGQSWFDHGTLTVTPGDYTQEIAWHGLGIITAPGRIFKITDTGASVRISSLEMR